MALSYYPELNIFQHTNPEFSPEPFFDIFHDNFCLSDTFMINPLFDPGEELFYYSDQDFTYQFPYLSSQSNHFHPFQNIKRQKTYEEDSYYSRFVPSPEPALSVYNNGFVPSNPMMQDLSQELLVPFPEFQNPQVYNGSVESVNKTPYGGTLSAQSIAARQRRRKITEKTQELGKLIPGGQKMNTAEMFQSAFKYIKYLQAQVGILEFMGSIQNKGEPLYTDELQVLLGSPFIQEKLYSEEKCLVPKKIVQTLVEDGELQSNTELLKDINQVLQTGG